MGGGVVLPRGVGFRFLERRHWEWVVGGRGCQWDRGLRHATQGSGHREWVLGGRGVLPRGVVGGVVLRSVGFCVSRISAGACYPRSKSQGVGCGRVCC